MKILKTLLPLFFWPILSQAVVAEKLGNQCFSTENTSFLQKKWPERAHSIQKLDVRLDAIFDQNAEPSEDEKQADVRALRSFICGILGISFLIMLPNWIAILGVPLLLFAFFNGTAAIKKTYRRGLATVGIVLGSFVWVFFLLILLVLLGDGF